jgi:PRTRC genetic system protein E
MFTELKPLLENRPLTLTIVALKDGNIRVCVIPQPAEKDKEANSAVGYKHKEVATVPQASVDALTTPLSLTGTPAELDAQLPELLANYVEQHVELQHSFNQAVQQIKEAVKAIDEREKNKPKTKAASKPDNKADGQGSSDKKPTDATKGEPEIPSLWCTQAESQSASSTAPSAANNGE